MPTIHHVSHAVDVDAAADAVYGLIADATKWPQYFRPSVHVERVEFDGDAEQLRIWATAGEEVRNWTSVRTLDAAARRITFRQQVFAAPVASMAGEWTVTATAGNRSRLTLKHEFSVVNDDQDHLRWLDDVTDRNSRTELANIKALAEGLAQVSQLEFAFDDTIRVDGPADAVYDFLNDAGQWPRRLPHVSRMDITEDVPGLQVMEMDTRTKDGSTHTTKSIRVCFPGERIVYKQTVLPALMAAHTGRWTITPTDDGVLATSRHEVRLEPAAIERILGAGATVDDARQFVRRALSANSMATLTLAKQFAESCRV
jgi:ribosome-associated toxin RatA of RatAB toxin-antitoxin module